MDQVEWAMRGDDPADFQPGGEVGRAESPLHADGMHGGKAHALEFLDKFLFCAHR